MLNKVKILLFITGVSLQFLAYGASEGATTTEASAGEIIATIFAALLLLGPPILIARNMAKSSKKRQTQH